MTASHPPFRVLCLPGSLRRDSWNRRLLWAAAAHAPATLSLELYEGLGEVPLFDEDSARTRPEDLAGVDALRSAVAAADGLLIATPEYNQSLPGVLKNALDWLSLDSPQGEVLEQKPVAITGASTGPWGTRLAQTALRQVLHACGALVMPTPTLFVASAASRFDADGRHADEALAVSLHRMTTALDRWIAQLRPETRDARPVCG
ncbi:NADPH-dependent FMN reductase [Dyella ginsengisoli]|uniref:NADPH-dependent FMN reductase n=1 Tax=Dyella ginsengisoli TaxID=363848 RepID=UPI0003494C40|nr:NADPH-dependent FMN reductase [Dyella ginsengisoli]